MPIFLFVPEYFAWHYSSALRFHLNIVTNFLWFVYHFFSIPILARTLFSPWRRSHIAYRFELHPKVIVETLVINSIMRIIGLIFRSAVLVFGILVWLVTVMIGAISFLVWLVLPLVLVAMIFWAFSLIFNEIL